jgi:hypothetical protein
LTHRGVFAKLRAARRLTRRRAELSNPRMGVPAMRQSFLACFAALVIALTVGCGGSQTGQTTAAKPGTSGSAPADPIAKVVFEFFDAVRLGRTAEANQRLTPLALQRITELEMNIAPPGSQTASFQVGTVTQRQNDHALVSMVWSDIDADGKPYNEPSLCELRVCEGQWRICGMAQDLGPGHAPMVIDFESIGGSTPQTTAQANPAAVQPSGVAPAGATSPVQPGQPVGPVALDPFLQQR